MPVSIEEAAYDLALRAIEQQEKRLDELRSRGGTLVAAASIAASVLGAQAVSTGTLEALAGLAIVACVCCVLTTLVRHAPAQARAGVPRLRAVRGGPVGERIARRSPQNRNTLFTAYPQERMRGETRSFQVLGVR